MKRYRENLKSIEWLKENEWKVIWLIGTPACNIWAPTAEELIFRAPLIVAFGNISGNAWWGILASSIAFAFIHYFGKKINFLEVLLAKENSETKNDDLQTTISDIEKAQAQQMKTRRLLHIVATLPLGILAGYYGIKYQSIWVSVGIHSVWNLLMPTILPFLVLLVMLAFFGITEVWDRFRWRYRRRQY
ncbi:MAG: CPBP family intramembrane metalloprotease [Candidatus Taylorbacteria bacterium]|nr:CPBP family intramembrane metalloprotease [Candidatus Taylorbacteria bacterium]